jgi:hypothetical protein
MSLTVESIRQVLREEINAALKKAAIQASVLGDGRRKMLTGAEVYARFGLGGKSLDTLTSGARPKVRAKLGTGRGRGGKVWRYSLEDLEREMGVRS